MFLFLSYLFQYVINFNCQQKEQSFRPYIVDFQKAIRLFYIPLVDDNIKGKSKNSSHDVTQLDR